MPQNNFRNQQNEKSGNHEIITKKTKFLKFLPNFWSIKVYLFEKETEIRLLSNFLKILRGINFKFEKMQIRRSQIWKIYFHIHISKARISLLVLFFFHYQLIIQNFSNISTE